MPDGIRPARTVRLMRDKMGFVLTHETQTDVTRYTRDAAGRPLVIERTPTEAGLALGVVPDTVKLAYDRAGRLIAEEGVNGAVGYTLDELDNLSTLTLPHDQTIDWLRYGSGHVHQIRVGDQVVSDVERDDLHREVMRTQGRLMQRTGYDALGRRQWQSAGFAGDAIAPSQGQLWRRYRYDATGELTEQRDSLRGSTQYQYDPAGQLLRQYRASDNEAEAFAWDAAGNLLDNAQRSSRGYVEGNRLRMWQDLRFEYDAWGNLAVKRKGANRVQRFTYDAQDRLIAVRTETPRGAALTRFEYDVLGRRTAKTDTAVHGPGQNGSSERKRFVWEGLRLVQEIRETGVSNYVYSSDAGYAPLARIDAVSADALASAAIEKAKRGSRIYHFHTDVVGSPQEVTDESGEVAWAGEYAAWGRVKEDGRTLPQARIDQPLRYPGQYSDESTGLHYNTFRYYDPDVGRFINQDPIGLAGGENLYQYAPNPVSWMDPWGWAGNPATATHITYQGIDAATGKPYVGYASMQGNQTAQDVLNYRYGSDFSRFGGQAPDILYEGYGQAGKDTARGLEQRVFEKLGGLEGTANRQNPVGMGNGRRTEYLTAADKHLNKSTGKSGGGSGC